MALIPVDNALFGVGSTQTPNLDDYVFGYADKGTIAGAYGTASRSLVVPRPAPKSLSAVYVESFSDLWYNRIHFIPSEIAFSDIAGTTQAEVVIWNAFFVSKTIASISKVNLEGVSFLGTPPLVFGVLQARSFFVEASLSGPVIDAGSFLFAFQHGNESLPVSVTRANVFPWPHNWQTPLEESHVFASEWLPSWAGEGQRIGLMSKPRRVIRTSALVPLTVEASGLPNPKERALWRGLLWSSQGKVFGLPLWFDAQRITAALSQGAGSVSIDTRWRDFKAGGSVMLYRSPMEYEVKGIASINDSSITFTSPTAQAWPAGTVILPVRSARLSLEQEVTRETREIETVSLEWQLEAQENSPRRLSLPAMDTYRGLTVFPFSLNEEGGRPLSYTRPAVVIDSGFGPRFVDEQGIGSVLGEEIRLLFSGHQAISEFLGWVNARDGIRVPFWFSDGAVDFRLKLAASPSDNTLTVEDWKFKGLYNAAGARRDIVITRPDGSRLYRRIQSVTPGNPGEEVLTLDSTLGVSLNPADFATVAQRGRISFLRCVVLAGNEIETQWDSSEVLKTAFRVRDVRGGGA